jgi:hypothetical protein
MSTKKYIWVVGSIGTLVALLGVWKNHEHKGIPGPVSGSSTMSPQSGPTSSDSLSGPVKTKADRRRAPIPPSPEEVEAALARRRTAVSNARQIGLGLFEFETEFGSFPNEETATVVKEAMKTKADLKAATANDCFYQLIAAGMVQTDIMFSFESPAEGEGPKSKPLLNLEKCTFSYLSGMNAAGNPSRPLVVAPLVPGTRFFDRKALGGKAIVLNVDNSVNTLPIEQDGTVMMNGMDLLDPAQPFWGGKVPTIRWPKK